MDLSAVPGLLEQIQARAAEAAPPVVLSMANDYYRQVQRNLRFRAHGIGFFIPPRGPWTNAPAGEPPALASGDLAGSVEVMPGVMGGTFATASVAPHTIYATVQEYGRDIYPRFKRYMHWIDEGGAHFAKKVSIPERPYMRPALEEVIFSGSLQRSAIEAFISATGM